MTSITIGVVDHWQVHELLAHCEDGDHYAIVHDRTTRQISVRSIRTLVPEGRYEIILRSRELERYLSIEHVEWAWPAWVGEWMDVKDYGLDEVEEFLVPASIDPWCECEGELIDEDGRRDDALAMEVAGSINADWLQRRAEVNPQVVVA